mmetsp:Transcript_24887/g.73891  ORF Transcript_24887/g.73891 Transcript_24887/m.73891 type:complete len:246 (+) Transcript_24887:1323-2060(+)
MGRAEAPPRPVPIRPASSGAAAGAAAPTVAARAAAEASATATEPPPRRHSRPAWRSACLRRSASHRGATRSAWSRSSVRRTRPSPKAPPPSSGGGAPRPSPAAGGAARGRRTRGVCCPPPPRRRAPRHWASRRVGRRAMRRAAPRRTRRSPLPWRPARWRCRRRRRACRRPPRRQSVSPSVLHTHAPGTDDGAHALEGCLSGAAPSHPKSRNHFTVGEDVCDRASVERFRVCESRSANPLITKKG